MRIQDSENKMVTEASVLGLEESVVASGLPALKTYSSQQFGTDVAGLLQEGKSERAEHHLDRAAGLGAWSAGEGHNCWLCGAIVQFNLTAPRYFWHEWQRYHFQDIVSSTSTMHSLIPILKNSMKTGTMDELASHFDKRTPQTLIKAFWECALPVIENLELSNQERIRMLKPMLPEGWLQTARITTNYRQLKPMLHQRHDHALDEWHEFIDWCRLLPMADKVLFSWRTEQ